MSPPVDAPPPRRFSRWALAAGAMIIGSLLTYFFCYSDPAQQVRRLEWVVAQLTATTTPPGAGWSFAAKIVTWLTLAGCLLCGPVCLVLGTIAQFELERTPTLRGEGVALLAVILGWAGTAGSILYLASIALLRLFE
ncbi:MAG: DUF4190 domain-containing protein [Planctomycetales bacterium]